MARRSKSDGLGDLLCPSPGTFSMFLESVDVQLRIDQTVQFHTVIEGRAVQLAPSGREAPTNGQPD